MDNKTMDSSLIEIEENLRNLASARTQVNNVSQKSEALVSEVSKLIQNVQKIQKELVSEKENLSAGVSKTISDFKSLLETESANFIKQSESITTKHSKSTTTNIEKLAYFQEKIEGAKNKIAALDFEKTLSEQTELLKELVIIQDKLRSQESQTIKKIDVQDENQKKTASDIKRNFELLQKNQNHLKMLLMALMVMVILGAVAVITLK